MNLLTVDRSLLPLKTEQFSPQQQQNIPNGKTFPATVPALAAAAKIQTLPWKSSLRIS